MKFCPSCGTEASDDARFCESCGHRFEERSVAPPPPQDPGRAASTPPPPPPPPAPAPTPPPPAAAPPNAPRNSTGLVLGVIAAVAAIAVVIVLVASGGGNGSHAKDDDANAMSDARNMVSQVESCYTDSQDYSKCRTATDLENTGLSIGASAGQVEVVAADATTYTIVAHSKSGTNFKIVKDQSGTIARSCDKPGESLCQGDGSW